MYFSTEFIERLRDQTDIIEIISNRVILKSRNNSYTGLCPFHNEKSPSFTVSRERQNYHCFGCGAHGDIISFIMNIERISFVDSVKFIANKFNIQIPSDIQKNHKKLEKIDIIYNIMNISMNWFSLQIKSEKKIIDYLNKRGITEEFINKWSIGFAPSGNLLEKFLLKNNFDKKDIFDAGLIFINDSGQSYDRFRLRIIFPIFDRSNRVIAFGGRTISDEQPKYLNSPETILFKKSEILYNENIAKNHAFKNNRIVIVEGYTDAIKMSISGFDETVAVLGTAISNIHIKNLWRYTNEPIFCLDGDEAGKKATNRIIDIIIPMIKPGYSAKFVTLPDDSDPDDILNKNDGKITMNKIIDDAIPLSEMIWNIEYSKININATPEKKALFENKLQLITNRIEDRKVRKNYNDYFSKKLWEEFGNQKYRKTIENKKTSIEILNSNYINDNIIDNCEAKLFATILCYPILLSDACIEEEFTLIELGNDSLDELRMIILKIKNLSDDLSDEKIFKEKILLHIEKSSSITKFNSLYNIEYYMKSKKIDINEMKNIWNCNINRFQIALLKEEKQKALDLLSDESIYIAKLIDNQINILENIIASIADEIN